MAESALERKAAGNKLYKAKDYAGAIVEYTAAIALDDTNHSFFSNRSACHGELGQWEESLADADKVIQLKPDFAKGYSRKATALRQLQRQEEALEAYRVGLGVCPTDAKLKQGLQQTMQESGRGLFPRQALEAALLDPEIKEWYTNDSDFKQKIDSCVNGMPNQMQLLGILQDPKVKKFLEKIGMFGAPPEESAGAPAPAPKKKAPEPEPEPELTEEDKAKLERQKKADVLKAEGTAAYKKKDFDKAMELYKAAADVCPEAPVYVLNQAAVFLMQGDLDGCEKSCFEAIDVARNNQADFVWVAKAYNRLATVAEKRGDLNQAVEHLSSSLQEKSDSKIKLRRKKLQKKLDEEKKNSLLNPEEALEWKAKADDAFRAGKWQDAIKNYEESLKRNPNDAKVYNNRSTALCKLMAWEPALEDVMKAIALKPDWVKPYLRKAKVEQALQKYHRAVKTLKIAANMCPDSGDQEPIKRAILELNMAIQRANMEKDPQRQKRALEDPEIQQILKDPVISGLLKRAETDPTALRQGMQKDKHIADSIEMLAAAGILQYQ